MAKRTRKPDQEVTDDLTNLEERMSEVARRSPLSLWVMRNFERLSELIGRYGSHWNEMAKWLTETGTVRDKHGAVKLITGDALRKAFEREQYIRSNPDKPAGSKLRTKAQPVSGPPSVRLLDTDHPAQPSVGFDKDEFLKGMKNSWER